MNNDFRASTILVYAGLLTFNYSRYYIRALFHADKGNTWGLDKSAVLTRPQKVEQKMRARKQACCISLSKVRSRLV